ncbi:very short patch repair endonuclease [Verrucomicrobium sp. BvORR034]|uniref:very short patch repair endonuclease n=1 Tax=Verrucomicrobium sp. BvORR034 TaxID=1396418 RepID=UPI000679A2CC|nr:very short patch repair endonuclease [Verrucomicrobium sp. BvORR034]
MPDVFTPEKRSQVMSLIRSTGNKDTELRLMLLLRAAGIKGWRRHALITVPDTSRHATRPMLKVKPDFVFWKLRVAVFVDGCFWHGCPRCYVRPKQNRKFWDTKVVANRARDTKVTRQLRKANWRVLRLWECTLTAKHVNRTMGRLNRMLQASTPDRRP